MKINKYIIIFSVCVLTKIKQVFRFNFTSNYTGLSNKENLYFFVVE